MCKTEKTFSRKKVLFSGAFQFSFYFSVRSWKKNKSFLWEKESVWHVSVAASVKISPFKKCKQLKNWSELFRTESTLLAELLLTPPPLCLCLFFRLLLLAGCESDLAGGGGVGGRDRRHQRGSAVHPGGVVRRRQTVRSGLRRLQARHQRVSGGQVHVLRRAEALKHGGTTPDTCSHQWSGHNWGFNWFNLTVTIQKYIVVGVTNLKINFSQNLKYVLLTRQTFGTELKQSSFFLLCCLFSDKNCRCVENNLQQ